MCQWFLSVSQQWFCLIQGRRQESNFVLAKSTFRKLFLLEVPVSVFVQFYLFLFGRKTEIQQTKRCQPKGSTHVFHKVFFGDKKRTLCCESRRHVNFLDLPAYHTRRRKSLALTMSWSFAIQTVSLCSRIANGLPERKAKSWSFLFFLDKSFNRASK